MENELPTVDDFKRNRSLSLRIYKTKDEIIQFQIESVSHLIPSNLEKGKRKDAIIYFAAHEIAVSYLDFISDTILNASGDSVTEKVTKEENNEVEKTSVHFKPPLTRYYPFAIDCDYLDLTIYGKKYKYILQYFCE